MANGGLGFKGLGFITCFRSLRGLRVNLKGFRWVVI